MKGILVIILLQSSNGRTVTNRGRKTELSINVSVLYVRSPRDVKI